MYQQIDTSSPLLNAFQNLGAISSNYGLYKIKPFRDWSGTGWQHKIFTFRLCNTGEVLEILKSAPDLIGEARTHYKKLEFLSRAIWEIDGSPIVTSEEVNDYNNRHHTELTLHEFVINWMHNLEDIIVERLDAIYAGLQVKQIRLLQGLNLCPDCGNVFKDIPDGSLALDYALGEIICTDCVASVDRSLYDFKPVNIATTVAVSSEEALNDKDVNSDAVNTESTVDMPYICRCEKGFPDVESYQSHIQVCEKYKEVSI
jgi:hypothetical protein